MSLAADILERIRATFGETDAETAIDLLRESGQRGRVARCIVFAARGDLDLLRHNIRLADDDYRDVIMAGEYDDMSRPVRDLRVSFLIDTPEKFWCSGVAFAMHERGYVLTDLDSRPADNLGNGEGVATFEGRIGRLRIEKRSDQWRLTGDLEQLDLHGLDQPFDDEAAFTETVSAYILARENPLDV